MARLVVTPSFPPKSDEQLVILSAKHEGSAYGLRVEGMPVQTGRLRTLAHALLPRAAEETQLMAMPASPAPISTIEELQALPDDGLRHELLDGVHVVTPAPEYPHQGVLGEFYFALRKALEGQDELQLLTSPADIVLSPRTLVQPDLFVVRKQPGKVLKKWSEVGVPVLAIEFLSPSTAARDRGVKRRIYQRSGVPEYWIVDLDARLVERWRSGDERPEVVSQELVWKPLPTVTARLDLPALFARVLGEPAEPY
jgi:Uma2 family endonuclease